jgi:hypothetical protein
MLVDQPLCQLVIKYSATRDVVRDVRCLARNLGIHGVVDSIGLYHHAYSTSQLGRLGTGRLTGEGDLPTLTNLSD